MLLDISSDAIYAGASLSGEEVSNGFVGCIYGMTLDGSDLPYEGVNSVYRAVPSEGSVTFCRSVLLPLYTVAAIVLVGLLTVAIIFSIFCRLFHHYHTKIHKHTIRTGSRRWRDDRSNSFRFNPQTQVQGLGARPLDVTEFSYTEENMSFAEDEFEMQQPPTPVAVEPPRIPLETTAETNFMRPSSSRDLSSVSQISSPQEYSNPREVRGSSGRPLDARYAHKRTLFGSLKESLMGDVHRSHSHHSLDPMTGMKIQHEPNIGRHLAKISDDDEVEHFVRNKVEMANVMTTDMSYDEVHVFADEGQFEPMGSIGSLHNMFTSPREMVDAGSVKHVREFQQPLPKQPSWKPVPQVQVNQCTSAGAVQSGFHKKRALSLPKSSKNRVDNKPPNYHLMPVSREHKPTFHSSASHPTANHPLSQIHTKAAVTVTTHNATGQVRSRQQPSKSKQVPSTSPLVHVASHQQKNKHTVSPSYQTQAARMVEEDREVEAFPPSDQAEDGSTTDYSAQMDHLLQEFQILTGRVSSTESINESRLI